MHEFENSSDRKLGVRVGVIVGVIDGVNVGEGVYAKVGLLVELGFAEFVRVDLRVGVFVGK
jgi:hypothetical protein